MIKKLVVAIAAMAGMALLAFGTDAFSYLRTYGRQVRRAVKDSVPLDFEIERARQMVAELVPDIRRNMHLIAEEEVEVEDLHKAIAYSEEELTRQREEMLALRRRLAGDGSVYQLAGRTYNAEDIRKDLARRFERYQVLEDALDAKRRMLEAREKSVEAAREKLDGMLAAKRDLEVQVEHLQARLKMVQAAQTTSEMQFDDSRLARAKTLVGDLRKRLDVAQRLLEAEGKFTGEIPVEEPVPDNIAEQIDEYFGSSAPGRSDATAL